ncbi:Zinc ABC transporter, inner membrane permease protein ZnuB [hydrothermal vent metagenome]|uniref:Zinc ABC transporter, inner membrane permease protein ZnuB n=1 Tax=hydrothermal vent metagenome TaxID=652676 RepID=A0A1W1EJG0_9ZZZZ
MLEALHYEFIQNAIIAGILVSFASGIIGSLIVVNRMVFLAGGIAHTSYGGIGIAIYLGLPIFFGATIFAIASALLLAFLTLKGRDNIDTIIGLIWAVGMAIGIIFIDLTDGYKVDLMSYLFGSILAVSSSDLIYMSILLAIIIISVVIFYREILAVSYDIEYASLRGINIKFFYSLILVLSALTVVIAIKIVGLILVIALLTIPIYIAQNLANSLAIMMILSAILSSIFTLIGLVISYDYDISSGATIILVSALSLIIFLSINFLIRVKNGV